MIRTIGLGAALWLALLGNPLACQMDSPFPDPTWESQIDVAPVVFIGHVTAIMPNRKPGWEDRVFLSVETPIKGQLGQTYEAMQGSGGDCGIGFEVGDWVIFAGDFITDPTVFLSDPLTRDQKMKLGHLKHMLEMAANAPEGTTK